MSSESIRAELLSLVEEVQEHVQYLQELGVERFAATVPAPLAQADEVVSGQPQSTAPRPVPLAERPPVKPDPAARQAPIEAPRPAPATTTTTDSPLLNSLFGEVTAKQEAQLPHSDESFEQIWADVGDCSRCSLCEGRSNIVHTNGNRKARLMFVGEAPGADEDAQAKPFVGRAGQLLTKIIEAIGLKREEVLIGNVNRCRPPGNRPPTPEEASECKPFLLREIVAARPEVIVVLGNTAMKNLLGTKEGITRVRGLFQNYKGIKVMPTFHPAYLLRDPSKKRETWEDLKKVRDYLDSTASK